MTIAMLQFPTFATAEERCDNCPNIVLLMVDTLRADKLGTYGLDVPASPEIDQLAARGVVFEKAISQASWTRASVASLLTSRYPRDVGVVKERWDPLVPEAITLAEVLNSNGYFTVGVTANPQLNTSFGFAQGFDRYIDSTVLFPWMKAEQGKVHADSEVRAMTAAEAFGQLEKEINVAPAGPIFAQIMLMDVHAHEKTKNVEPHFAKVKDGRYVQAVRRASKEIGRFVEDLGKRPNWKNTLIVITSDHGEGLRDHPNVGNSTRHGNLLYRSQIHVPLILYGTGSAKLKVHRVPELVQMLDLSPSILDVAGISPPKEMTGRTLQDLIDNSASKPSVGKRLAFAETAWREVDKHAVTDGEWIFIDSRDKWPGTAPEELQQFSSLQNGAVTSLIDKKPEIASALREELRKWREQFGAKPEIKAEEAPTKVLPREIEQLKSLGYL